MEFKDRLRKYRQENGLTQEELAGMLFVSRSSVAKWEQGRSLPSSEILAKISELAGTPADELISQGELRSVTIGNQAALAKNKTLLRIILIFVSFAVLFSAAVLCIYIVRRDSASGPQSNGPYVNKYDIYAKVNVCGDSFELEDKYQRTYKYSSSELEHVEFYNRDNQRISYSDISEGWYLMLMFEGPFYNYKAEELKCIQIVEGRVSDYKLYGFFISTTGEKYDTMPVNDSWFGYTEGEEYYLFENEYRFDAGSFKFPFSFNMGLGRYSLSGFIKQNTKREVHQLNGIEYETYNYSNTVEVDYHLLKNKKISIYAADNSEKGFYLYDEVYYDSTVVLEGLTFDGDRCQTAEENRYYDKPLCIKMRFEISIKSVKTKSFTVYEFDENFEKLEENYYDFYERMRLAKEINNSYPINSAAKYFVIREETPGISGDYVKTYVLGRGDKVEYCLATTYGFVNHGYYILDL